MWHADRRGDVVVPLEAMYLPLVAKSMSDGMAPIYPPQRVTALRRRGVRIELRRLEAVRHQRPIRRPKIYRCGKVDPLYRAREVLRWTP